VEQLEERALGAKPAWHIAAHHAAFAATTICELQLILRSCGSGVGMVERNAARYSAWLALH